MFFVRVSVRLVISYFSEAYHSSGNPLSKWKVINIISFVLRFDLCVMTHMTMSQTDP